MATKAGNKTKRAKQPAGKSKQKSLDDLYDKTGEVNGEKGPQQEKQSVTGDKQSPVEPAQDKGEALPVDLQELQEKHLRLRAEYDNHIKRTHKERGDLTAFGVITTIRALLPVLDDLKRTVDHARQAGEKNDAALLQGIEMVLDKFNRTLATAGVKPIESVGKPFDPLLHEALMSRPVKDQEAGVILEEFETGYIYHDRVIRHAKVVVSA